MAISVTCTCGRSLRARDELAGRRVRCPGCGGPVFVPQPQGSGAEEIVELLPADVGQAMPPLRPVGPPPRPLPHQVPPPTPLVRADEVRRRAPVPSYDDDSPEEEPRTRRKKVKKRTKKRSSSGAGIAIHPSIITGALMMVGAVVWFVVGLYAGRVFFYPPILFVLGIAAVVRGFMGSE